MAEKLRKVTIRSGNYEEEMELTQAQYDAYMRPWWQQKKREQRNRDVMEEQGYSQESYDEWKDKYNDESTYVIASESVEKLVEKNMELELLGKALDSLMPDEREMAMLILTREVSLAEYARQHEAKRTTMSDKKSKILHKLKNYFRSKGYEI